MRSAWNACWLLAGGSAAAKVAQLLAGTGSDERPSAGRDDRGPRPLRRLQSSHHARRRKWYATWKRTARPSSCSVSAARARDHCAGNIPTLIETLEGIAKPASTFAGADRSLRHHRDVRTASSTVCTIVYNSFTRVDARSSRRNSSFPSPCRKMATRTRQRRCPASYEYEPDEEGNPRRFAAPQPVGPGFPRLLENRAREQGARMTAMDSARATRAT